MDGKSKMVINQHVAHALKAKFLVVNPESSIVIAEKVQLFYDKLIIKD